MTLPSPSEVPPERQPIGDDNYEGDSMGTGAIFIEKPPETGDGKGTQLQPIVFTVHGRLDLGSRCVCCGKQCSSTIWVDLAPVEWEAKAILAVLHPLSLLVDLVCWLAVRKKGDRYVPVPCCSRCRLRYYLPEPGTGWLLIVFIASIAMAFYNGFQDAILWMLAGIALMFGATIWFALGNRGHARKRLPLEIVQDGEWLFYFFHGGYGYEWARRYPVASS